MANFGTLRLQLDRVDLAVRQRFGQEGGHGAGAQAYQYYHYHYYHCYYYHYHCHCYYD